MSNKQTAVEWLIQNHFGGIENCTPDFRHKIEQAKEMEKEQIMNAFDECGNWQDNYTDSEHYYNETYGGNK
jgi:hypothetical protein